MEEARWGAVCPGTFLPVLILRADCSLFTFITNRYSRLKKRVKSKGAESYVAQKSDRIILALFVLSQAEGPGRAIAGRTSWGLHLQHLHGVLSTGHAERAREAASSPTLLNVA
jgi:hypothetical protein